MGAVRTSVTLALVLVIVVICGVKCQINHDKFEGDPCKLDNGMDGVCQRVKNCPSFRVPSRGRRPNPPICSFLGTGRRSEPIICCAPVNQPIIAVPTPRVPVLGNRLGGEKSNKACEELKKDKATRFKSRSVIPLILGGEDTMPGEYPHMALLGYDRREGGRGWNCGGALISDRYVLTAAHCIKTRDGAPKRVRLGEHDLNEEDQTSVDYSVEAAISHPQYGRTNSKSWYDDIGLLRLAKRVVFTREIFPACLFTQSEEPSTGLIVTGWGATAENGDPGSRVGMLQKGLNTLELVAAQACNKFYPARQIGQRLANGIQTGMFCATDPKGKTDTCQGDSGGPLQVMEEVTTDVYTYRVVGITSGGQSTCGGAPAIYTRVFHYLDWIESVVWP